MEQAKLDFINEELYEWADWIDKKLREKFSQMDIGFSDELINSLSYQVFNSAGLNDGAYELSFLEYGRMVDMGAGRKASETIAGNRKAYRKVSEQKIRKAKKWYSKTTYGGLNRLINGLVNGYQDASLNSLKDNLTN